VPGVRPYDATMVESRQWQTHEAPGIALSLPFSGRWLATNSPSRRVPSHGTNLMGERYAIDFTGVDDRHRTSDHRDWRTFFSTEPADRFYAFGQPILAPSEGTIVLAHDGETDHVARRSQLALVPYALGQRSRLRQGVSAIAGNHVIIALRDGSAFVALVHLRRDSIRVAIGERVVVGQQVAECGNSGNSTQPHVHVQAMDSLDLPVARGLPMYFRPFREWRRGAQQFLVRESGVPEEGSVVEPLS